MQPLDQRQGFEIERADLIETLVALDGFDRLHNALHGDALYVVL